MADDLRELLQTTLGDAYTIEHELGGGGMSRVFVAVDTAFDRRVVLKTLPPELTSEIGVERFRREIRFAGQLHHPYIVPVLTAGQSGGCLYYVMPHVPGESLRARLERERQLPIADAIRIAQEVAEALDFAHRQGIVHRDVKPENVLFADGHALVTDFGIARAISSGGGERTLTATGLSVGTPTYMSPEQASGERDVDGRADVYALGCVLYEMVTGTPPFAGATPWALLAQHMSAPPPSAVHARSTVPASLDRVLQHALAKAPADRFATAAEFSAALVSTPTGNDTLRSEDSETVLKPSGETAARGPALRSGFRALVVTGVAIAVLGLAFAAPLAWRAMRSQSAAAPPMLAVMPFANTGRPEDDYFADGMADEISTRLAALHGLGVISRTSTRVYKNSGRKLQEIGRELHADYVLEGSVRWDRSAGANRVRVTPQLVRVADDRGVWSSEYDAELADVFTVQGSIAAKVAVALSVALVGGEARKVSARPTENLDAYESFLRAKIVLANDRGTLESSVDSAIALLVRATAMDSTFAEAHATLASAYISKMFSWEPGPRLRALARREITRAFALDSSSADAEYASAALIWTREEGWQHEEAIRRYRRVIALRPNDADAHAQLGTVLFHTGLLAEGLNELRIARKLDPNNRFVVPRIPRILWQQQHFDSALAYYVRGIGFEEEHAIVLGYLGRGSEGLRIVDTLSSRNPRAGDVPAVQAVLLARIGKRTEALARIRVAEARGAGASHFHHAAYQIACAYALLGNLDAAMQWLRKTADDGMPAYELFAGDPILSPLRSRADYVQFMQAQRVQWERLRRLLTTPEAALH